MSFFHIELRPYALRLLVPLRTAHGELRERRGIQVRFADGLGNSGLGEACPLPAFGTETLEQAEAALRAAMPALAQANVDSPAAIEAALDALPILSAAPSSRCGLELALLDLGAKRAGVPLRKWLSPSAIDGVATSALLVQSETAALIEEALQLYKGGSTTLKVKVAAGPLAADVERVRALRAALGAGARIRLDANGGFTVAQAHAALAAFAPFDIELCEQPLAPGNAAAWPALRRHGIPLAADESVPTADFDELLASGAIDAVVLKPQVLGGHLRALRIAGRARLQGADAIVTTSLDGAAGRSGAEELAAALGPCRFAHGLATGRLLEEVVECPVATQARLRPQAPALFWRGTAITYADLDQRIRRAGAGLRALGVRRGDRLALLSEATPDAAALVWAAARAGAPLALLSTRLLPREVEPLLARLSPRFTFAQRGLLAAAASIEDLCSKSDEENGPARLQLDQVQTLIFTSGTSGAPKAVMLTTAAQLASARAALELLGLDEHTRWLCTLPLFHVGGLAILIRCALAGGAAILHERFDAAAAARDLDHLYVSHASLVATTLQRLLEAWGDRPAPPSLRAILVGGGPTPPSLLQRAQAGGFPVLQTYGLSEAGSHVTCERPGEADGATAGEAIPGTEVRVMEGLIEVRGSTLMAGYLDDDQATAAALQGGWLRTGDLGSINKQSRLFVSARRTDLIVTGGENVAPAEVEAALAEHPAVAEAAAIGRPDATWGQAVVAAVVLRRPCPPDELRAFLRARLAGFKVPRAFIEVRALPRTPAGKVDRPALAELVKQ